MSSADADFIDSGVTAFSGLASGSLSGASTITFDPAGGSGTRSETITFTPDNGQAAETLTVVGTVIPVVVASSGATYDLLPGTLTLGQAHVGGTVQQAVTLQNYSTIGSGHTLSASISNGSGLTASGTIAALAPLQADASSLNVGLNTAGDGVKSGVDVVTLSDSFGSAGVIGTGTIAATGTVFNVATANLDGSGTISLGLIHPGQVYGGITLSNLAVADGFSEGLDVTLSGASGGIIANGNIGPIAAGQSGALSFNVTAGTPGTFTSTASLAESSDGSGVDSLGSTAIGSATVTFTGTVQNYATAALNLESGDGTLTGGGNAYLLNFGTIATGSTAVAAQLGINNSAVGLSDALNAVLGFSSSTGFSNPTDSGFTSLAAGATHDVTGALSFTPTKAGTFSETFTVTPTSSNTLGTSQEAPVTVTVSAVVTPPPCFVAGTRILTARGEVAVERLAIGDLVITLSGRLRPITWIGERRVECARHPQPESLWPVRVVAGAFGPMVPHRDVLLSPDHAVFLRRGDGADRGGMLTPVRYLQNGATVREVPVASVHYFHVELDRHDVLLAEGLPSESYLDTGNRSAFANGGDAVMAHPDFALKIWEAEACASLVVGGAAVIAARGRLLRQASTLGHAVTADPDLHVLVNGRRIEPQSDGARHSFALPDGAGLVRLVSRVMVAAEMLPDSDDRRRLGVAVLELSLDGMPLLHSDPGRGEGWHAAEPGLRWTDGQAVLDCRGASVLEITLSPLGQYWDRGLERQVALDG